MTVSWEEMAQLVTELAVQTSDGEHDGPSLLEQLRRAVWGNTGRTVAGAGGKGLPIDIGAHMLWEEIVPEIEAAFSGVIGQPGTSSVVVNLLGWHSTFGMRIGQGQATELMQEVALDRLRAWSQKIRDQFDAPLSVPLRGLNCPNCGDDRAVWFDRDLELSGAAIVVTIDGDDLVATCRNRGCTHATGERSRWIGDAEVLYMARRAGIDVDALAAEIRDARKPVDAAVYVEPDARRVEDFDPDNPDHMALLGGEAS